MILILINDQDQYNDLDEFDPLPTSKEWESMGKCRIMNVKTGSQLEPSTSKWHLYMYIIVFFITCVVN